jgi:hypothetical protein
VPWINIVRHPYAWLYFYIKWRTSNMNMPLENTLGIDHEWSVTCHDDFAKLPLNRYERKDVYIWSAYQGMHILNRMVSDLHEGVINRPLEDVVDSREKFNQLIAFITRERVTYNDQLLDEVYAWVNTPFRGQDALLVDPMVEYASWPGWKKEAFEIIVNQETRKMFVSYGYEL